MEPVNSSYIEECLRFDSTELTSYILYEIHFINLNDLKLKIICKIIKIQQEFLNMNHNEQLNTVLLHEEK